MQVCVPLLLEYLQLAASDCSKNLLFLETADPQGKSDALVENEESCYADLRFLRLAKTLRSVWISNPAAKSRTAEDVVGVSQPEEICSEATLSSVVGQDSLWNLLSRCLTAIESQHHGLSKTTSSSSSISPALSRLQPLVEAYFVVHSPLQLNVAISSSEPSGGVARSRSGQLSEGLSSPSDAWIDFAERHRNSLNAYLRQVFLIVDFIRFWYLKIRFSDGIGQDSLAIFFHFC